MSFEEHTSTFFKSSYDGKYFFFQCIIIFSKQTHCTNAFCILSVHEIGYQTGLIHQRFKDMCVTW
jgi:hypothetical protein